MFRSIPSKLTQKISFLSFVVLSGGLLLAGCAGVTSPSGNAKSNGAFAPPSVTTQPASVNVTVGQTATFSVAVTGTAPLSFQWQKNAMAISGATSSTYTTPPTTAADNRALFTVMISNSAGSITSSAGTLNVSSTAAVAVQVNPNSATVSVSGTQQFAATVTGTSNTAVTWTLSGAGCSGSACGTISGGGLYTAPAGVPTPSTLSVIVTSVADPTKSASASISVVAATAVLLSMSPTSASVPTAGTSSFTATVTGTTNTAVAWSLNGPGCSGSSCGTVASSALAAVYTAPLVAPSPASVNVVATSMADPSKTASATVAIMSVVVVTVTPASTSVVTGATLQLNASVVGNSNTAVTWAVQGAGCNAPACGTVNGTGLYTAPSAVPSPSTVTVTATSSADPSKTGSASLSILSSSSTNTVDGLTIPTSHPRLFWNAAKLAKAQQWWTANSYTPSSTNVNPFDPYDALFACEMTNNQAVCNAQINWALNLSASACYQGVACDAQRVYGEAVMLTYDWLYAQMTPAQRTTIITNWNLWQNNLDTNNAWGNTGMPASNYFAGAFRTDFSMGVATFGDNPQAANFVNYALNNRWAATTNFASPSGAPPLGGKGYGMPSQEGSQYGRYLLSYQAVPMASSALLGRDLWQETTAFKSGVLQTIYNTLPTPTVSRGLYDGWTWSDDEGWVQGAGLYGGGGMQSRYYGDFMMAAAQEFPNTAIGKMARQWISTVNPTVAPMWMATDPGGTAQALSTLPLDYYASGPQFAYWRNNWNTNASSLFLQMGQTQGVGHTHFDVGNFQWFRNGSYLIRETPSYITTVAGYNSSAAVDGAWGYAHNVPFIGGVAGVNAGCTDSNGVVRRMESQASYAYIDTDISGTYTNNICSGSHPERENTYAQHVEREFVFFRDIEVLLILDRLQADTASRSKTFVSHCENNPTSSGASHYNCTDGTQKASYSVLLPAKPTLVVVNEASNGATCNSHECQYRLEVNDNSAVGAQSYFLVAIQGLNASGTALTPTVQDNGTSWTITIDANHIATLNKGMSSAGGSVTINGVMTNLRADAQPMSITDSGPVWK
jgi:hypothetical protein